MPRRRAGEGGLGQSRPIAGGWVGGCGGKRGREEGRAWMIECWKSSVVETKNAGGRMMIGGGKKNSAARRI